MMTVMVFVIKSSSDDRNGHCHKSNSGDHNGLRRKSSSGDRNGHCHKSSSGDHKGGLQVVMVIVTNQVQVTIMVFVANQVQVTVMVIVTNHSGDQRSSSQIRMGP
ncbi:hypothetical protein CEXT_59901 [Caerostris extrusa]|uniref:Uncharacterized protein n=1 Tax=Caerostris extrusa TaxID=172846 RepID=A0AAV4RJ62_CAEEX|nr:hypothetical protein CEXT_59901 [Caerostris extrusa]